jgi:hypothetical protein
MKKSDIEAFQKQVDEIADRDDIHNPDDTSNLSSTEFLDVTDEQTQDQLEALKDSIQERFVDVAGFADHTQIRQAKKAGVKIDFYPAQDPGDDDVSVIGVTIGDHGMFTVPVQHEEYR